MVDERIWTYYLGSCGTSCAIARDGQRRTEASDRALVLVQAARLALDRLECEFFDAALAMGMRAEAIAAVLELPDAAAAGKRHRWLQTRRALPYAAADSQRPESGRAAKRSGAAQAADDDASEPEC